MNDCGCNKKNYNFSMGCCQPVLGPIENYYTKYQIDQMLSGQTSGCCITPEEVDEKIEEAISGITPCDLSEYWTSAQTESAITSAITVVEGEIPSLSGYATEQWVLDKGYITGVDLSDYATIEDLPDMDNYALKSEIPSLSGYATEQWVLDKGYITGVDLSDYVTFEDLPELTNYATKQWVISQNYAFNSEVIQYITNLQQQINSITQAISGCCAETGETEYRWITMTSESDYCCSGTTKMSKEKEQSSTDGITWVDTGNYRTGSTILEENSTDCGYVAPLKFRGTLRNKYGVVEVPCNSSSTLSKDDVYTTIGYQAIEIGDCVTIIGEKAFLNQIWVSGLTIPSGVTTIEKMAFDKIGGSEQVSGFTLTLNEGLITIGEFGFAAAKNLKDVVIPDTVETIGNGAFESCNSLSSVTIGSGVTSIGNAAFAKSTGETQLSNITILAETPPTIATNTFGGSNCQIYVPVQSVNTYKTAQHWSSMASRIQAIP